MADNTVQTGADTIATDDIAGVKYQRVKVTYGADGSSTDVATASPLPVLQKVAGTATGTNVSSSATDVTLLAANSARLGATIFNDSTVALYVNLGAAASFTAFVVKLAAASYYEVPFGYTGSLHGLWDSATGAARICELT